MRDIAAALGVRKGCVTQALARAFARGVQRQLRSPGALPASDAESPAINEVPGQQRCEEVVFILARPGATSPASGFCSRCRMASLCWNIRTSRSVLSVPSLGTIAVDTEVWLLLGWPSCQASGERLCRGRQQCQKMIAAKSIGLQVRDSVSTTTVLTSWRRFKTVPEESLAY